MELARLAATHDGVLHDAVSRASKGVDALSKGFEEELSSSVKLHATDMKQSRLEVSKVRWVVVEAAMVVIIMLYNVNAILPDL